MILPATTHLKRLIVAASISAAILPLQAAPAMAESSWWEKGISILKSLDEEQVESTTGLSTSDMSSAFKQALRIGSENVVQQLGRIDGFNSDPAIHIPLPGELVRVKELLGKIGMSAVVDDLELKLNRAAEAATPRAKELFADAITSMTFEDVKSIYQGPSDAATQYFRNKMTPGLTDEMRPIVADSLSQVGAIQAYDRVMNQYKTLPFVPDVKADLTNHAIEKSIDGIFFYLAKEETAIRQDPARHTTELLQRVFGATR